MAVAAAAGGLTGWAERSAVRRAGRLTAGGLVPGRLRFAFYGRVSTEDWQDPVTSRARQREQAEVLVCGHGIIVAEFVDVRGEPYPDGHPAVGAAPAGRCTGGAARRSGPGVGRDRDRGVRAGVLRTSTRRWRRCSSIAAYSCGRRRWAAGSTTSPRTMSRRCWRWACRRSGRSPGPGSGSAPRWPRRPGSRAGTSAAARRTGTGWAMRGRIRTRRTRRGAGARTGWSRTRSPRRWSGGCSPGGWPGSAARITRALNDAGMPCPSAADPGRNPHRTGAGWTLRTVARSWESAVHGPAGVEPAAHRYRPGRPRQYRPRAPAGAAVEPARGLGDLEVSRASGAGQRG